MQTFRRVSQRLLGTLLAAAVWISLPSESTAAPAEPCAALQNVADTAARDSLGTRCRGWLRTKIVRDVDLTCYGIVLDENCGCADPAKPLVIIVHGYNSCPARNAAIAQAIRAADLPCGVFAYPNDYTIVSSAQLLSSELRRLRLEQPKRRVILVCHSMGGMVARACVEDSLYDPGNVDRLILIAPPNAGTAIAHFAIGTDVWEHWLARREGGPWSRVRDSIVDGLGEAAAELCPGSEFLSALNSRSRHPNIKYSVILGTGACMSDAEIQWVRESVIHKLAQVPGAKGSVDHLESLLGDMDELVEGKGDGVVAVSRGRLDGVSDTLVLPFGHLAVTGEPETEVVKEVQTAVLQRLN